MQKFKENIKKDFKIRLYRFVLKLINNVGNLSKNDSVCRVISDQVVDSGTGILSNYFRYSLKCSNETKMWIALLRDSKRINIIIADELLTELIEISNIFASSLITLKNK